MTVCLYTSVCLCVLLCKDLCSYLPEKPCRGDNWRTKIVQVKKAKHSLSYAVFIVHMKIRLHLGTINYVT